MKLLMITQDFPPETGGIQTYSLCHARELAGKCDRFGVICPDHPDAPATDNTLGFPVSRLKSRNDLLVFSLLRNLNRHLSEHPADATFHAQWQTAAAGIRARNQGLIKQVFVAAHIRELLFNPFAAVPGPGKLFTTYRNRILRQVDHFYPVSDYTARTLMELGVDASKITVVINGTDPQQFYPDDASGLKQKLGLDSRKVILTITRLVERKGLDTVLDSLRKVLEKVPEAHYLVVGDGEDRPRLESITRKNGLAGHVTFTGRVPYNELNSYYNAGDLFVMPSRTKSPDVEGFGIVFLEANACGLPVIGSDSGGIPSAIIHGTTGFIVPEGDSGLLADRIIELLTHSELRERLGSEGRRRVVEEANWQVVSSKLFEDMQARLARSIR
jgi:phosphatidyl-myo-inositol dimannoside synthase